MTSFRYQLNYTLSGIFVILSNQCQKLSSKLEELQEQALGDVYCDYLSTCEELLQRVKLPTLHT